MDAQGQKIGITFIRYAQGQKIGITLIKYAEGQKIGTLVIKSVQRCTYFLFSVNLLLVGVNYGQRTMQVCS
jgi:hypothetical protein